MLIKSPPPLCCTIKNDCTCIYGPQFNKINAIFGASLITFLMDALLISTGIHMNAVCGNGQGNGLFYFAGAVTLFMAIFVAYMIRITVKARALETMQV